MQAWGLTDVGCVRTQNQDEFRIVPLEEERLLTVVCDGMGGAKSGNIASHLAIDVFTGEIQRAAKNLTSPECAEEAMAEAVGLANTAVFEHAQLSEDFRGMGTTLVSALLMDGEAIVANVGDSRCYYFGASGVRRVTTDHSLVEMMVQRGELTREQAKNHPSKNLITRAVGTEPSVQADLFRVALQKGDCLLLCTDGLSNLLADQELLFEVAHGVHREDCCRRLLQIAKDRGAPDNVTSVLITV